MAATETTELLSFPLPDTFHPDPESKTLAELADAGPAARAVFGPGRLPVWLIVRHAPARAMLADPRFSRAKTLDFGARLSGPQVPDPNSLLWLDPPAHTRVRTLVAGAFGVRRVEGLRPFVRRRATELVAGMVAAGPPADLREALAFTLPIEVICQLLGVPDVDRVRVRAWSQALFRFGADPEGAKAALGQLFGYIDAVVADRDAELSAGAEPVSLLDSFIAARDAGDRLSPVELRSLALTTLIGGYETTGAIITNSVGTLLTDRSRWEFLVADRSRLATAVEELFRVHPLSMTFPRVALADVDLGDGLVVRAGEVVIAPFTALNRDPALYDEPDHVDLTREPVPNLTFGHGIHYCLGAQLARMELTEALTALLDQVPSLRLEVPLSELRYDLRAPIGRPERLPVGWDD